MLIKNKNGFYTSTIFSDIPGFLHAFSTRQMGDAREEDVRNRLASILSVDNVVWQQQTHGNTVSVVHQNDTGRIIQADGMVTNIARLFITVHVGDCVPILFVDPETKTAAAVHAGWRGSLVGIAIRAVDIMQSLGAKPMNIRAVFGPHIGMCCYGVQEDRARQFLNTNGQDSGVASIIEDKWHLSLARVNFLQLTRSGLLPKNIDAHPTCTSCRVDEFYSYRKDSRETFGEIMGIVGFTN